MPKCSQLHELEVEKSANQDSTTTKESTPGKRTAAPKGSAEIRWQLPLKHLESGYYKACIWTTEAKGRPTCSRFKIGVPLFQAAADSLLRRFSDAPPA